MWIENKKIQWINIRDRAVQFGDGCFTTAAVINGNVRQITAHLTRLKQACNRLIIKFSDWQKLETEMKLTAAYHNKAVLKVIISRGIGAYGYSPSKCNETTCILSLLPFPSYTNLRDQGVKLVLSPVKLARNPLLAGIKHLNRLEQVMISSYIDLHDDADEALVLDTQGKVIECCTANIFWRTGNDIFTTCLANAGVDGTMRRFLLNEMEHLGKICKIVSVEIESLISADEIIICNALMPILPVIKLEDRIYDSRELFNLLVDICKKA
ncbi:aminodeoxychorismate lyase [Candidatus Ishikawella capsulata]|uniref:Aminodeoxychorismate lyase n=1 Tax=Candidatus Ishikawaella capsulata Mpkobe TaxID=476281 RepID=C5WD15_9ENTR|nr:aminodeoxychorismate lyase [Candidatus Ishikawaella capsulata]BAH83221.1 4-amino-4-deoxychorismate lyase [Candidatus Ishikawaella capsulata Mpkobe]